MPRTRHPARVQLTQGVSHQGMVFVLERVPQHDGPETPLDMLNRAEEFFAFEPEGEPAAIWLVAKAHTVTVSVDRQTPIADATRLSAARMVGVELLLAGGTTLGGWASYELPRGHGRLIDYLNESTQPFFVIWTHATTHYVNRTHVLYARPLE